MSFLYWLAAATVQCSFLSLGALVINRYSRDQSAAQRHRFLVSISTVSLLCPLFVACLPPLRVLPWKPLASLEWMKADLTPNENHVLSLEQLKRESFGSAPRESGPVFNDSVRTTPQTSQTSGTIGLAQSQESETSPRKSTFASVEAWVVWIWIIGCCLLLSRILISWMALHHIRTRSVPFTGEVIDFNGLRKRSQAAIGTQLLLSDAVKTPLSFGLLAPCVILPTRLLASDHEGEKLEGIVLHELAHIARHDAVWQWAALLSQSLHWFNPLIWIVSHEIGRQREIACDDRVIESGVTPRKYAQALLETLPQTPTLLKSSLALSLSSAVDMETRIRSIFDSAKNRAEASGKRLVLGCISLGATLVVISILRADEPQTKTQKASAPPAESSTTLGSLRDEQVSNEDQGKVQTDSPKTHVGLNFSKAKLERVAGRGGFIEADFGRARLTNAILSGGDSGFQQASFEKAVADGAMLLGGDSGFQRATFENARLSGAVLSGGQSAFRQSIFDGANLEGATFFCGPGALIGASVSGTNFDMADLRGIETTALESWIFDASRPPKYTNATRFPEGFSPSGHGWEKPADSVANNTSKPENALVIFVTDEEDQPLSGVRIFQNHLFIPEGVDEERHYKIKNHYYFTDGNGRSTLTWSGDSVDLRIWVGRSDYVPVHAMWAAKFQPNDSQIPDEFSIHLAHGATIGGVVHDESGNPVERAFVEIENLSAGSQNLLGNTERPVPSSWLAEGATSIVTDKSGRWRAVNVPRGDVDLRIRISHADFSTFEGNGAQQPSLRELRDETAIISLDPGANIKESPN